MSGERERGRKEGQREESGHKTKNAAEEKETRAREGEREGRLNFVRVMRN